MGHVCYRRIGRPAPADGHSDHRDGAKHNEAIRLQSREGVMLWTIFVILLVLWLLGMVSSYTLGGFIHVLLVVAIVIALIQLIQGRRVV
jgi:uncharacterized protein DUF5670